jgi:large subunit ribosomal protein L33
MLNEVSILAIKKAALACTVCGSRNYSITANDHKRTERLEVKKFCRHCGKHTIHRETK